MSILVSPPEEDERGGEISGRKFYRFIPLAVLIVVAILFMYQVRLDRARRLLCTSETTLKLVKRAEFCLMCYSSDSVTGEVITYSYEVKGTTSTLDQLIEYQPFHAERWGLFGISLYPSKVCYQPGNPSNAYLADAGALCGQ